MAGKDIVIMSIGEVRRLKAVEAAMKRHITQKAAASMLRLSERQVRRLVKAVREQGDRGIIHALRGHPSNRILPDEVRGKVLSLYQERYPDFGPTFATEKLFECDDIKISDETLRKWLIEAGSGRRDARGRSTGSGGSGRSVLARWFRWTDRTMIGLKGGGRSWC